MALTDKDRADIAAIVASTVAAMFPAKVRPAAGKAAESFHTRAEVKAGKGFPCTAAEPCGRTLSTIKRAAIHGVSDGGHTPREA